MADNDESFRISGEQLMENMKTRDIVGCTLSFDIGLGGGIPRGATVVVYGPPKLGKTTVCLQIAANAQKEYGAKVFAFPIEGRLTNKVISQIQGLKLDADHFEIVYPPAILDDNDKVIGHKKWPAERWWTEIGKTIKENPGCIMIIDSIAQLSPEKELSEGVGYQDRGTRNKLESQFCREFGDLIVSNKIICFILTQIQANTSGYGAATQPKMGNQLKHQADVILAGKTVEKWPEVNGKILGHDMKFIVQESALGSPHAEISVPLRYGKGIDKVKDVITNAINWDIIKKGGAWFTIPFNENGKTVKYCELKTIGDKKKEKLVGIIDDKEVEPLKFQGEANLYDWFSIHTKETDLIEKQVRELILGN